MRNYVIIFTTCASKKQAAKIAFSLLQKRLIACATIISSVESRFWWKGKIDCAREELLILKTTARNARRVEADIKRIHSYDVPEVVAVPIIAGSREYLKWIDECVKLKAKSAKLKRKV